MDTEDGEIDVIKEGEVDVIEQAEDVAETREFGVSSGEDGSIIEGMQEGASSRAAPSEITKGNISHGWLRNLGTRT